MVDPEKAKGPSPKKSVERRRVVPEAAVSATRVVLPDDETPVVVEEALPEGTEAARMESCECGCEWVFPMSPAADSPMKLEERL